MNYYYELGGGGKGLWISPPDYQWNNWWVGGYFK